ncbi:hypothetical protein B0H11DRAFT_1740870 [Mycena galericulata]|nr:hypothetical protein B0H11DRAFT_1740870 [Mycena galericulata]
MGTSHVDCSCGEMASFRCPECGVTDMVCARCLVGMHRGQQCHHVEQWDGFAFVRTSLYRLGHQVHLGHRGRPCEHNDGKGREFVLVDTNGIHLARILYCGCEEAPARHIQLVRARLFPATLKDPKTVFTFDVLHNFHVHNLTSKKPALDYYRALQKLTDNARPGKVPDRYREFMRVVRVWRHMAMRRRSGQAQNIDSVITNRRQKSLVVRCPACPEVGFNVDKATIDAASENEKHKYMLQLSSDGNFKLQRKKKVDDPDDFALNGGNAYFPEDTQYRDYVSRQSPADDVRVLRLHDEMISAENDKQKCTCSELKAVRMQNIAKFKNSVISGVVAVQCARHGFFMPGGMVDLKKGEGYAHTDYALGQALGDAQHQRWILLSYDVYCQFFKNITTRFLNWFPSMKPLITKLSGVVPKMHIRNHIGQCQSQWSTNFTEFIGFLIGELIEGSWAELNQFAGSTKEQNHGHRHDTLDDGCGQWNWDKVIRMAQTLLKMYREACAAVRKRSPAFERLTAMTDPELITQWSAMDTKWTIQDGKYWSPYDAHLKGGPPTHRSAYEKLITAELNKSLSEGTTCKGDTEFISRGLRIEKEQHRISAVLKTSTTDKALGAKSRLRKELGAYRIAQVERFPHLRSDVDGIEPDAPEKEKLFLPSDFDAATRASTGMKDLAAVEYELRVGQAHDALADVRIAIKTFNFNLAFKIAQLQGQSASTRAQNFLRILANDRILAADEYRRARGALIRLGLNDADSELRPLVNDELYAKNNREPPKMGESHAIDPWFWTVGRPANLTPREEKDWSTELDRVKWFRDRADRDRAVEQKELVEIEFGRTITSFVKNAAAWKKIQLGSSAASGHAAYARLKDLMYTQLALDCVAVHASVERHLEKDRLAEEAAEDAELKRKGLLNKEGSTNWEVSSGWYGRTNR